MQLHQQTMAKEEFEALRAVRDNASSPDSANSRYRHFMICCPNESVFYDARKESVHIWQEPIMGQSVVLFLMTISDDRRAACLIAIASGTSCPEVPSELVMHSGHIVVGSLDVCNVRAVDGEVLIGVLSITRVQAALFA